MYINMYKCDTHLKRNIFNKNRLKHEKTENKFWSKLTPFSPMWSRRLFGVDRQRRAVAWEGLLCFMSILCC
jgi:hypothetical protein